MKGYEFNAERNVEKYIEDDTPFPDFTPPPEPPSLNIGELQQVLNDLKTRLEHLERFHRE